MAEGFPNPKDTFPESVSTPNYPVAEQSIKDAKIEWSRAVSKPLSCEEHKSKVFYARGASHSDGHSGLRGAGSGTMAI